MTRDWRVQLPNMLESIYGSLSILSEAGIKKVREILVHYERIQIVQIKCYHTQITAISWK